ncbi:hypothetical protein E8E11_001707 [Didymella keratinophila]|nr:hypothetical protein E8E11_001707 [Didymella keratinophila]
MAVKPTDNLLDHLRVVGRTVCIFHHISFLRYMEEIDSPLFPGGFVKETIDTLILLFPDNKKKDRQWLHQYLQESPISTPLDRGLLKTGYHGPKDPCRYLGHYTFWRDRLEILGEAVEKFTPPTQAFKRALKNSKGEGWINSWIGVVAIVMTLFFGLVQSIEGAIQVYKAYH